MTTQADIDRLPYARNALRRTERGDFDAILSAPRDVVAGRLRTQIAEAEAVMKTKEAFETLATAIREDSEYAWGWHCNIAMASVDEGMDHAAANRAAARFMRSCFHVDTSKSPQYATLGIDEKRE